jgi:hypothetical protein
MQVRPIESFWSNGVNQITAVYSEDTNYKGSTSSALTVNVIQTAGDFTFAPRPAEIVVSSGSSGSAGLNLASPGGFSGNVGLACAPSSTELGCKLSPASAMVNATGTGRSTLTLNAFVPSQAELVARDKYAGLAGAARLAGALVGRSGSAL